MRPLVSSPRRVVLLLVVGALLTGCATATSSSAPGAPNGLATTAASGPASTGTGSAGAPSPSPSTAPTQSPVPFVLTSSSFAEGAAIPARYTCTGADVSPPLAWSGVPAGAASLVLLVDDPDARGFLHWSVIDLPPSATTLPEHVAPTAPAPQQGTNDFGKVGYGGPCPPSGTHHYRFTLYALAGPIDLPGHPDAKTLRAALSTATVLAHAALTATFGA